MLDVLQQIRAGLDQNLYYLSLFTALAVPDICGAIDSEDGRANEKKYADWFDKYMAKYPPLFTGEDCYSFRCSLLHQGSLKPRKGRYSRMIFVEPSATTNIFHRNIFNDALNIDVRVFCQDIMEGAVCWLNDVQNTERFKRNYSSFVRRYPSGLPPYIVGVPVIG